MNSRNPVIAHAHLAAEARRHAQAVPFASGHVYVDPSKGAANWATPADDTDLDAIAFGLWAVVAVLAWSVALWEWLS